MFPDDVPWAINRDLIFPVQLTNREQVVNGVTVVAGGSSYAVNDTIGVTGGTSSSPLILGVTGVSGGSVTATMFGGGAYSALPSNPVSQASTSGGGSGATFNLSFNPYYNYSWFEQGTDTLGNFTNIAVPRSGNAFVSPAVELNNVAMNVATSPYVWLRLRAGPGGILVYEFAATGTPSSDTISNSTINYIDDTLNYVNSEINFTSDTITYNRQTRVAVNAPVLNFGVGPFVYNVPFEICADQAWCCATYTFANVIEHDWLASDSTGTPLQATVLAVTPHSGGTTVTGIVPYGAPRLIQQTPGISGSNINTIGTTFPSPTQGTPNQIIAEVWGHSSTSMSGMAVTDTAGNTYSPDTFIQDGTSGQYAGVYRCNNPAASGALAVTFTYTGGPGTIQFVAQEVYGLPKVSLDKNASNTGTSNTASAHVGGVTLTGTYEYEVFVAGGNDTLSAATVTAAGIGPTLYSQTNGAVFTPGFAGYNFQPAITSFAPTLTFDSSVPWAAAEATYFSNALPQLLVLVNEGIDPLYLANDSPGTMGGRPILLPSPAVRYTAPLANQTIVLYTYDAVILWYDICSSQSWIVLAYPGMTWTLVGRAGSGGLTALSGVTAGSGTVEVYYNAAGTMTDTSISLTALNLSTTAIPSSVFGILSLEPSSKQFIFTPEQSSPLLVRDTFGHTVTGVSTITLASSDSVSGSAGSATVTPGGGGSSSPTFFQATLGSPKTLSGSFTQVGPTLVIPTTGEYWIAATFTGSITSGVSLMGTIYIEANITQNGTGVLSSAIFVIGVEIASLNVQGTTSTQFPLSCTAGDTIGMTGATTGSSGSDVMESGNTFLSYYLLK